MKRDLTELRNIDLVALAPALGLSRHQYDKQKWVSDGYSLSINGQKFYDHMSQTGGGGAIDFVGHMLGVTAGEAISWLRLNEGNIALVQPQPQRKAPAVEKRDYCPPPPAPEAWPIVRRYLVSRCLDPALIDDLHSRGIIYATRATGANGRTFSNAVFQGEKLAEIVGVWARFKGLATGSDRDRPGLSLVRGEPGRLVLTESAIDSISFFQLHPEPDYRVISTAGIRRDAPYIREAIEAGIEVVCAYDNDLAGDKAYLKMKEMYPQVRRYMPLPPGGAKDWNDVLRKKYADSQK